MKAKYQISARTFLPVATLLVGLVLGFLIFGRNRGQAGHADGSESVAQKLTYTCSMHPQIRQEEPGTCPICEMELTPVGNGSEGGDPLVLEMSEEAMRLADIQTTVVGQGQLDGKKLLLSGKIQPDERAVSTQVAHIPGRIERLFITFTGEPVRKGQAIARLYSPPLVSAQQELLEAIRFKGQNSDLAEAARNKLRYWKVPDEFIQQTETNGKIQREITLYADRGGVVMNRKVAVGDYVEEGSALFELSNLNQLWALFEAYETDLAFIRMGNLIQFSTPAVPGRTFSGRISFIDPVIDPQSRTASLRAEIQNAGALLKPEMLIQGELKVSNPGKTALEVPKTAVLWTGKRSVVYVKKADATVPSFEYREVELGESGSNSYLVIKGLNAGDEVVTNGAFVIDASAQLNNQQSMMNKMLVKKEATVMEMPDMRKEVTTAFREELNALSKIYLQMKDDLVKTNAKASATHALNLTQQLEKMKKNNLSGEAASFWQSQQEALRQHVARIKSSADVEAQRVQFDFVSQLLIQTFKVFGTGQGQLFVQHCPMAFNNRGADWLSAEEKILNPYFGDEMLNCGFVVENVQ